MVVCQSDGLQVSFRFMNNNRILSKISEIQAKYIFSFLNAFETPQTAYFLL